MSVIHIAPFTWSNDLALSDTVENLVGAEYLHNYGTGGVIKIRQRIKGSTTARAVSTFYLAQGDTIKIGRDWVAVNSTSTTATSLTVVY